jgi:hypothetical protein
MSKNPDLGWYSSHPYVKIWREKDTNSYMSTINHINTEWNTDVSRPITFARVDSVLTEYLNLLLIKVREVCKKELRGGFVRTKAYYAEKFGLNKTESEYIFNNLKTD